MSRRGWLLFVAVGVIWGVPYLLIKVAVGTLSPASLVFFRTLLAALLLLPLAATRGQLRPRCCATGGRCSPSPPSRSPSRGCSSPWPSSG